MDFHLHPKQMEIFSCPARFRVVGAGRRFGKSYLSAVELLKHALQNTNEHGFDLKLKEVWYIAPSFEMGKGIIWPLLKHMAEPVTERALDQTCVLRLVNGRTIKVKGADNPNSLRGVGISFAVLDEFAFMKREVWDTSILPTLTDVLGRALIIGTPDGRNHFFEMYTKAKLGELGGDWEAFHANSKDNPFLPKGEIENAKKRMSYAQFKQEYEASFDAQGGAVFKLDELKIVKSFPGRGDRYMTLDPAGYASVDNASLSKNHNLDRSAMALVEVHDDGKWYFKIIYARRDPRTTAILFLKHYKQFKPLAAGVEQGALKNAIMPYLTEEGRKLGVYMTPIPLRHNNQSKKNRIIWALQGRLEHGNLHMVDDGTWPKDIFMDELGSFPNRLVHDDGPDALAYVDQMAVVNHFRDDLPYSDTWQPLDVEAGF